MFYPLSRLLASQFAAGDAGRSLNDFMKKIFYISSILLAIHLFGKDILPSIFDNYYFFWIVFIILSILIPIGFSISINNFFEQDQKKTKYIIFIALFLLLLVVNLGFPLFTSHMMKSCNYLLNYPDTNFKITRIEEYNSKKQECYAKIIFEKTGLIINYKDNNGKLVTYNPNDKVRNAYKNHIEFQNEQKILSDKMEIISRYSGFQSIIQLVSFLVIIPLFLMYKKHISDKKQYNL